MSRIIIAVAAFRSRFSPVRVAASLRDWSAGSLLRRARLPGFSPRRETPTQKPSGFRCLAARGAAVALALTLLAGHTLAADPASDLVSEAYRFAAAQYSGMLPRIAGDGARLPRSFANGDVRLVPAQDWTSGFFAGSLWLIHEQTGGAEWKAAAQDFTARVEFVKDLTGTHDLGFMLGCSYGQGWRLTRNPAYREVLIQGARSLSRRFNPTAGVIRSWDWGKWKHPVIVDNMMNLELLLFAHAETGEVSFREIALSHANKTMANHYRPDGSSYHVVDYDPATGQVISRQTWQGAADGSAWARGQAWGLYGFTMMARLTRQPAYLSHARKIASFILSHPRLPADGVPYWDFDAPGIPYAKRDASAAAIIASALIDLAGLVEEAPERARYLALAERQLGSLSSPTYRAGLNENGNFILMHCVGSMGEGVEVDAPLVYADYYLLEALSRWKALGRR